MNTTQITAFLISAKYRSFTKAAEDLFMTAQNVSSLIRALENEVGYPVFTRSRQGLQLTQKGDALYSFLSHRTAQLEKLKNDVLLENVRRELWLRIGFSVWINPFGKLDAGIHGFLKEHPEVIPTIASDSTEALYDKLENDELDILILPGPQALPHKGVELYPFAREQVSLFVPADITDDAIDPDCWGLPILISPTQIFNFSGGFDIPHVAETYRSLGITSTRFRVLPSVVSVLSQLNYLRAAAVLETNFGFPETLEQLRRFPLEPAVPSYCTCVCHRKNEHRLKYRLIDYLREYFRYDSAVFPNCSDANAVPGAPPSLFDIQN